MKARKLLQTARVGEAVICRRWRKLWGKYRVCVSGRRRADGELLILISNEPSAQMLAEYARRWQIETLFGCLKRARIRIGRNASSGFRAIEKAAWIAGNRSSVGRGFAVSKFVS